MREIIKIYKKHQISVDMFIIALIKNLPNDYAQNVKSVEKVFQKSRYIQLIYGVDLSFKQLTPVYDKRKKDTSSVGSDKSHYFLRMILNNENIYISNPYIHHKTGKASFSVVHLVDDTYYVFDINLIELLEDLKLIEFNSTYDKFKRAVYFFGSSMLTIVSIILMGYGAYIFVSLLLPPYDYEFLHKIFKAIIAITLGLAIYDLAKQIFEHEVLYQSFDHPEERQYKVLGKFLISIVVALSIETLMVVFKITLNDYSQLSSAFYLLIGTTAMLVGLGWFYKTIKETEEKKE